VLGRDEQAAESALAAALAVDHEGWQPESTANNLRLIREARAARGDTIDWADRVEEGLRRRARGG
jgi:hypothetical protein